MQTSATPPSGKGFRFTGKHMTIILVLFFGIVIAVNVYMARLATSTFTGEVVKNSYDASQQFDTWLDAAAKEKALGWNVKIERHTDGRLMVAITGSGKTPVPAAGQLSGEAWHPLGESDGRRVTFSRQPDGSFVSFDPLPAGRWELRLRLEGDGHVWHAEERI